MIEIEGATDLASIWGFSPDAHADNVDDPLTWFSVKRLPRRALLVLGWMLLLADADGMVTRQGVASVVDIANRNQLGATIALLEGEGLVRRMRKPAPYGSTIKLIYSSIYGEAWRACLNCPRPVKNVRGARYCASCQAALARHDRSWKAIAFDIWADGMAKKQPESRIVYRAHTATGHPIFTPRSDGGDHKHEGIVQWMLDEGLISDPVWRTRARSYAADDKEDFA